jgi:hypothetical protein
VTPEGDQMVLVHSVYRHRALAGIEQRLKEADDFDWDETVEPAADGSRQIVWVETGPGAADVPAPLGRRILATVTLTPATLEIDTMSRERLRACRRRLEQLVGDRIRYRGTETQRPARALREPPPPDEAEAFVPPPELVAQLEEQMLRRWLDESIPALGGMTPREAAETEEGRRHLMDLFDYMARDQEEREMPPGMFSPDYSKAKAMLGLE